MTTQTFLVSPLLRPWGKISVSPLFGGWCERWRFSHHPITFAFLSLFGDHHQPFIERSEISARSQKKLDGSFFFDFWWELILLGRGWSRPAIGLGRFMVWSPSLRWFCLGYTKKKTLILKNIGYIGFSVVSQLIIVICMLMRFVHSFQFVSFHFNKFIPYPQALFYDPPKDDSMTPPRKSRVYFIPSHSISCVLNVVQVMSPWFLTTSGFNVASRMLESRCRFLCAFANGEKTHGGFGGFKCSSLVREFWTIN